MYFIISGRFTDTSPKLFFYLVLGKEYNFRMLSFEPDILIAPQGRTLELTAGELGDCRLGVINILPEFTGYF